MDGTERPTIFRREPVMVRAVVAALATILAAVGVRQIEDAVIDAIVVLILAAIQLWALWTARQRVTPVGR